MAFGHSRDPPASLIVLLVMLILLVPSVMRTLTICLYLSRRYDHAVQMDTREGAVEITPARGSPPNGRAALEEWEGELNSLLRAAHEGRKLRVEARGGFEERRVADALIDRELGAGDHLRRVFGGDQIRVLVLRPVRH
jgi:hypothetical protein